MSYDPLVREAVRTLPVYEPGRPIEIVARELGLDPATVIKLASNENPLGACPAAVEAARRALVDAWLYPENGAVDLRARLSTHLGVEPEEVVVSAGSNEIFYLLCDLFAGPGVEVVMGAQAFITYRIATLLAGATPVRVPMPHYTHDLAAMRAAITDRTRLVFLPNPNNPTGTFIPATEVLAFARSLPDHVVFCYDEAYAEYLEDPVDLRPLIREGRRVICARTFSKIYGLAGLRLGYGYAPRELIRLLNMVRPPFNTSSVSHVAGIAALADKEWVKSSRDHNMREMSRLQTTLLAMGLEVVPSHANFLLVRFEAAEHVYTALQQSGIIVRPVKGYDLPSHLRITIGTEAQNTRLLETLRAVLASGGVLGSGRATR